MKKIGRSLESAKSGYVAQTTNRFVWDGQVLLAIVNHTNGLMTSFARGLDLSGSIQGAGGVGGVLAVVFGPSTNSYQLSTHFCAFDGNGNVSALVSTTNGAVTATYEYSPFGETLRANGVVAKANPIRFSTQLADDVTGRKKFLHRELTDTGRWLSRDPSGEYSGMNLYGFVNNDSLKNADFLGLAIIQLPPGTEGPPGYRECGRIVYADGRTVILWCRPDPPSPIPPWMQPPPGCASGSCGLDPYGCWAETNPYHLLNPGVSKLLACLARKTGCLQCCERKFPITGGSTPCYANCIAACEDNYKRCAAFATTTPTADFPKPWKSP